MITGFNTDVRHGDVVFHVQTEDKGTGNPCVESLVYVGGQILARKRAGYRSLLDGAEALKAVAELMERQHRSMIQQIRAGKMDEKLAAIKGAAPAKAGSQTAAAPTQVAPPPARPADSPAPAASPEAAPPNAPAASRPPMAEPATRPTPPRPRPAVPAAPAPPAGEPAAPPAQERTAPVAPPHRPPLPQRPSPEVEPPARRPPAPPPIRPRPAPPPSARPTAATAAASQPDPQADQEDRTLDQVILDYLEMESDQDRLVLTMNRREGELAPGQEATLLFRTESSVDRDRIGQAQITVRLISTIDEPQVLAEGRTDNYGELVLKIAIPELKTGSGALIISAESSIGNAETRHLI